MYRCLSGFAACLGDAAGTRASIVLFPCRDSCRAVFVLRCLVWMSSVLVVCAVGTFDEAAWRARVSVSCFAVSSVKLTPVRLFRGGVAGFGQSGGDPRADGLQRERHGLPAQRLPGPAPAHPARRESSLPPCLHVEPQNKAAAGRVGFFLWRVSNEPFVLCLF